MPGLMIPANAEASRIGSYAHSSARDAAIPSPYVGLQVYLEDIDKMQFWDGNNWQIMNQDLPEIPDPIPSYADPTARDSALPSPTEGQTTYIQSLKSLQVYNGTVWIAVGAGSEINPLIVSGM
jgi:hypothetical protein